MSCSIWTDELKMQMRDVSFLEPCLIDSLNMCSLKRHGKEIFIGESVDGRKVGKTMVCNTQGTSFNAVPTEQRTRTSTNS